MTDPVTSRHVEVKDGDQDEAPSRALSSPG